MDGIANALTYLFVSCGAATAMLLLLVIYGNVLDSREDDQIYINRTEERIMAGNQPGLIRRMNHLAHIITILAVIAGVTLLASLGIVVWVMLH
jgi:hypothetical protein